MKEKTQRRQQKQLGDAQAMAYVRAGNFATAALADTGSPRTIVGAEIAQQAGAVTTGKRGRMNIAGQRLKGELKRMKIETLDEGKCAAEIVVFVPDVGQKFRKGLILGMDFMQKTKMIVDAETGEAFCPPRKR